VLDTHELSVVAVVVGYAVVGDTVVGVIVVGRPLVSAMGLKVVGDNVLGVVTLCGDVAGLGEVIAVGVRSTGRPGG